MSPPVLQAALRPSAAQAYPYLPARMWITARRLAELVARYSGIPAQGADRIDRVLSDRDFMFAAEDRRTFTKAFPGNLWASSLAPVR